MSDTTPDPSPDQGEQGKKKNTGCGCVLVLALALVLIIGGCALFGGKKNEKPGSGSTPLVEVVKVSRVLDLTSSSAFSVDTSKDATIETTTIYGKTDYTVTVALVVKSHGQAIQGAEVELVGPDGRTVKCTEENIKRRPHLNRNSPTMTLPCPSTLPEIDHVTVSGRV